MRSLTRLEMLPRRIMPLPLLILTLVATVHGQVPDTAKSRALAGCWAITAKPFKDMSNEGLDSRMTTLPERVRLDTVPGMGLFSKPRDWLLRAIPDERHSRWEDGWFSAFGREQVKLTWSTGSAWLWIDGTVKGKEIRGRAYAGTDGGGDMQADVMLQRVSCP